MSTTWRHICRIVADRGLIGVDGVGGSVLLPLVTRDRRCFSCSLTCGRQMVNDGRPFFGESHSRNNSTPGSAPDAGELAAPTCPSPRVSICNLRPAMPQNAMTRPGKRRRLQVLESRRQK